LIYSVVVYNALNNPALVLKDVGSPRYSRSKNAADTVNISIPRNSTTPGVIFPTMDDTEITMDSIIYTMDTQVLSEAPLENLIRPGLRFEILISTGVGTTSVECSGFVSKHGYDSDSYIIEGFTEEIVLSRYLTPSQYGYPLYSENATLDALVGQLSKTFVTENAKHGWGDFVVDSSNVDWTTNPTFVLLQNSNPGGEASYPSSGYAIFRFQKLASEEWERFRWVSDCYTDEDGAVKTEVSYRQGNDTGSMGSFTTAQPGALTDIVGIIVADPEPTYLDIRVDFSTDTSEASPVLFSLEVIKRGLSDITEVEVIGDANLVPTPGLSADNATFLDVIVDACEESGWEFKVYNGKLSIAETFGNDTTNNLSVVSA
jgi:hypothetical protein